MTTPALDTPDFPKAPTSIPPEQRASAILGSPLASGVFGPRPIEKRRSVPGWRRALFILSPLVTTPLKASVGTIVGMMALGVGSEFVFPSGAGLANGIQVGVMGATLATGPAMMIGSLVGLVKMSRRTRQDLGKLLDQRRHEKQMKTFKKAAAKARSP